MSATTIAGTPFDFVGNLLSAIVSRITAPAASTSDATSTSATSTPATSTAATSTPSIADSFFGALFSRIAHWFADAANGITKIVAETFSGRELCLADADGTSCYTRSQMDAMVAATGQLPAPPPAQGNAPEPTTTPTSSASTMTPESSTSAETSDAATSSPAVTESIPPIIDSPPIAPEEKPEPTLTPTTAPDSTEPAPISP